MDIIEDIAEDTIVAIVVDIHREPNEAMRQVHVIRNQMCITTETMV
jgi:hypothetical protein